MAVTSVTTAMAGAINYTVVTDSSADWASVANSTYFYDKADKLVHYKDSTGNIQEIFSGSGITVGTTPVTSGTDGRVFFQAGGVVQQDGAFNWDNTNKRLGIGANATSPSSTIFVRTNTSTAHDVLQLSNGFYGNSIFRVRDNATASDSTIGSLFVNARIYGGNNTIRGTEFDLGGYGLGSSYGENASNAVWLVNQGNNGDGAGTAVIAVNSNVYVNFQTTKRYKFETTTGNFGIGNVGSLGARLDVRAQGALSTDIAFRVRNSADTANIVNFNGNGQFTIGLGASINLTANAAPEDTVVIGRGANASFYGVAVGAASQADWNSATSVGAASRAGITSVALGYNATAYNGAQYPTLAIGYKANASGIYSGIIAVGDATASNPIGSSIAFAIQNGSNTQSFFFNKNTNVVLKSNSALTSGTHFEAAATNTITIHNGTAPVANITDAYAQYSADITAGNAAPHFRTENGAIVKVYQETTAVAAATLVGNAGTNITDTDTFDGYTLKQIVKALRNQGLLA